ncbi:MAG: hypothetical protein WBA29_05745 [Xanthobacteraceae bacterium]
MSPDARKWLNRIGALLGLAGAAFVGLRLTHYAGEIDAKRIGAGGYLGLTVLALIYGASNVLLALAWWRLLHRLGVSVTRGWALRTYAVSQLAKYVPGNIFQFAGRQAIGVAAGIGNVPLAKSTALELALIAAGGALFAPLIIPLLVERPNVVAVSVVVFMALAGLALWLARRLGGAALGAAALYYLAFLALSGAVFAATFRIAGGALSGAGLPGIVGAYVLAWLAGLVTPGAPAGIGVREAVLLFLLAGFAAPPTILLAVVIGRAVTVLGDLGFYLVGGHVDAR